MTLLTHNQADILLDVYEICVLAAKAHEQWECHKRGGEKAIEASRRQAVKAAISRDYQEAVELLCEMYHQALAEGVAEDRLDDVVERYLPKGVKLQNGKVLL